MSLACVFNVYICIIEDNFLKPKIENKQQIFGELQTYAQIAAKGNAKLI